MKSEWVEVIMKTDWSVTQGRFSKNVLLTWDEADSVPKTNAVILLPGTKVTPVVLCSDVCNHKSVFLDWIFGFEFRITVAGIIVVFTKSAEDAHSKLTVDLHVPVDVWNLQRTLLGDIFLTQLCLHLSHILSLSTDQNHQQDHPQKLHDQFQQQKQEKTVLNPTQLRPETTEWKMLFTSYFTRWSCPV